MTLSEIKQKQRLYWFLVWRFAAFCIVSDIIGYMLTFTSLSWWVIMPIMFAPTSVFLLVVRKVLHYDFAYLQALVAQLKYSDSDIGEGF